MYIEVTRMRPNAGERTLLNQGVLVDIPNLESVIVNKMEGKLGQLLQGKANLLLLRSSRGFVSYPQAHQAFQQLLKSQTMSGKLPLLSALLFDDGWKDIHRARRSVYVDQNPTCQIPISDQFVTTLKTLSLPPSDPLVQEHWFDR